MKISEQVQTLQQETVGKLSVAIGGGGTGLQILTDYTSVFVLAGNALLVCGGLYLMSTKILESWRNNKKVPKYLSGGDSKKGDRDDP
jgi:hypothetical protein